MDNVHNIRRIKRFLKDERGGVSSLEFTLMAPVLIIVVFVIVQFVLLAQQMLVMRQAAYSAARSALVYQCQPVGLESWWDNPLGTAGSMLFQNCTDTAAKRKKIENAMRMALITISPSSDKSEERQGTCKYPQAAMQLLLNNPVRGALQKTLHNRACYAFEPDNALLNVAWVTPLSSGVQLKRGPPPVKVVVRFKLPVLAPSAAIFANGKRKDGSYYRAGQVEVTLL